MLSKKIEKRQDKSFDDDLFCVKFIYRPLSRSISRRLNVSPNLITCFSLLAAVLSGFFLINGYMIGSLIFAYFWQLLDHLDGDVAHHWNKRSKFGDYFDTIVCYLAIIVLGVACSIYYSTHLGYLFVLTYLLSRLMYHKLVSYGKDLSTGDQVDFVIPILKLLAKIGRELTSASGFLPYLIFFEIFALNQCFISLVFLIFDNVIIIFYLIYRAERLDAK